MRWAIVPRFAPLLGSSPLLWSALLLLWSTLLMWSTLLLWAVIPRDRPRIGLATSRIAAFRLAAPRIGGPTIAAPRIAPRRWCLEPLLQLPAPGFVGRHVPASRTTAPIAHTMLGFSNRDAARSGALKEVARRL